MGLKKVRVLFIFLALSLALAYPPHTVIAETPFTHRETRFLHGYLHTQNGKEAFALNQSFCKWEYCDFCMVAYEGDLEAYIGVKIYKVKDGTMTDIGNGIVANVTIPNDDVEEKYWIGSWNTKNLTWQSGDSVLVEVWMKLEGYSWNIATTSYLYEVYPNATFITEPLPADNLNGVWDFYYYTWRAEGGEPTTTYFYFFFSHVNQFEGVSRIENFQWQTAKDRLMTGLMYGMTGGFILGIALLVIGIGAKTRNEH